MADFPEVRTIQQQVVERLRRLILEGDFAPGDKLQQEELAERLGVSAMPIREGLRQLEAEGLVRFISRRGAFVTSLNAEEFEEIHQMREALEILAIREAAGRIDRTGIETLRALLSQVEQAEQQQDALRRAALIRSFLWTLFEFAGRRHLFEAIQRYYNMTFLYQRQYSTQADVAPTRTKIYRRMLEALEAGDVEGAIAAHRDTYRLIRETMLPLLRRATSEVDIQKGSSHGQNEMA